MSPFRGGRTKGKLLFAVFSLPVSLLAVSLACEDDGPFGRDDEVAAVMFLSLPQNLELGFTMELQYEIRDADGNLIDPDDVTFDFSTSDETIATVSETGLVTPIGPGSADISIRAGSGTAADTVRITVVQQVSSLEFVDTELFLITGETRFFVLRILDPEGEQVHHAVDFAATSSNPAVASINQFNSAVIGLSEGTATITATARTGGTGGSGASATIEVTVFAASSGGISLTGNSFGTQVDVGFVLDDLVVVRDGAGLTIPDAELVFSSTRATVASVDAAGMLTATAPGETYITVTSPEAAGSATFQLRVLAPDSIEDFDISPSSLGGRRVGGSLDFSAVAETNQGEVGDFFALYTSSDEAVATVHPLTGLAMFVGPGMVTITARNGDLSAASEVQVLE